MRIKSENASGKTASNRVGEGAGWAGTHTPRTRTARYCCSALFIGEKQRSSGARAVVPQARARGDGACAVWAQPGGRSLETAAGGISAHAVLLLLEPLGASVTPGTSGC